MTDEDTDDGGVDERTGELDDEWPPSGLVLTPTIRGGDVFVLAPTMRGGSLGSGGLLVTSTCSLVFGVDVVYSAVERNTTAAELLGVLLLLVTGD